MPDALNFKKDSLIYCDGDVSDKVFILKSGKVRLVYDDIETGKVAYDTVEPGEFFGVRSVLGRYPREENAVAFSDCIVAAFTVTEFELYAMSNTEIIFKIFKSFSNQMRRIHIKVWSLLNKREMRPDDGLFGIGEKYLENKRYSHALYIFNRYLDYYPEGKDADDAVRNIELAEIALSGIPLDSPSETTDKKPQGKSDTALFNASKSYNSGIDLIKKENFTEAMEMFTWIVSNSKEDSLWATKSIYETGRCLFFLNKFEDCIKHYNKMIEQFPKHPDMEDAMFYMGQSNEKLGKKEIAIDWYQKIVSAQNKTNGETRKKALQAIKEMGEKR